MQSDRNSFCGDVVLGSVNLAIRDEFYNKYMQFRYGRDFYFVVKLCYTLDFLQPIEKDKIFLIKSEFYFDILILDARILISETTIPQKLFRSDCITL